MQVLVLGGSGVGKSCLASCLNRGHHHSGQRQDTHTLQNRDNKQVN
jgi:GTPase SAR1 family protein